MKPKPLLYNVSAPQIVHANISIRVISAGSNASAGSSFKTTRLNAVQLKTSVTVYQNTTIPTAFAFIPAAPIHATAPLPRTVASFRADPPSVLPRPLRKLMLCAPVGRRGAPAPAPWSSGAPAAARAAGARSEPIPAFPDTQGVHSYRTVLVCVPLCTRHTSDKMKNCTRVQSVESGLYE